MSFQLSSGGPADFSDRMPPAVDDSIVVATFHTHPQLGEDFKRTPSPGDISTGAGNGVPGIIRTEEAGRPVYYEYGPDVRLHLALPRDSSILVLPEVLPGVRRRRSWPVCVVSHRLGLLTKSRAPKEEPRPDDVEAVVRVDAAPQPVTSTGSARDRHGIGTGSARDRHGIALRYAFAALAPAQL